MSYETAFNTDDYSDDAIEMMGNQNRFYALLENYPVIILPLYCWDDCADEQAQKMQAFLFALFNHNGIVTTDAAGVSLSDPSMLGQSRDGLFKHSKMRRTDFLILTDVHGETDFALNRLVEMAATDCKLPFIARVYGKGFEAAVDIAIPNDGGWKTILSASLINMLLQSRCSASPAPLLDLPFAIECVYETTNTEKKLYKLTDTTEFVAHDVGNHRYTHWEDYPARGY